MRRFYWGGSAKQSVRWITKLLAVSMLQQTSVRKDMHWTRFEVSTPKLQTITTRRVCSGDIASNSALESIQLRILLEVLWRGWSDTGVKLTTHPERIMRGVTSIFPHTPPRPVLSWAQGQHYPCDSGERDKTGMRQCILGNSQKAFCFGGPHQNVFRRWKTFSPESYH
jgi:hypothetical protein